MNNKEAELRRCKYCGICLRVGEIYSCSIEKCEFEDLRPEPPVGEWEEDMFVKFCNILSKLEGERKIPHIYHEHRMLIFNAIRKLIKPKPPWREVEEGFNEKFCHPKSNNGMALTLDYENCEKILNQFKQYFTEE